MARLKYKLEDYNTKEIDTRLGKVIVDVTSAICFPKGIVGFGSMHYYCLAEIPDNKLPGALLLQSIENDKTGFIVLPLATKFYTGENSLLSYEDILDAASTYQIKEENMSIMVISTISKIEERVRISINLKAPIILDSKEKTAYQHVFVSKDYPLTYYLN